MAQPDPEAAACHPRPIAASEFNPHAVIPYGCTVEHIHSAMDEFLDFLKLVNLQLRTRQIPRLESFLMPANFSSMVGEFMTANIPKYCDSIAKNLYHNGHPDLVPKGVFPGDAILHAEKGIEVKASRYRRGWQGHNPEDAWLMVFVFDANSANDPGKGIGPKPFRFREVLGTQLAKEDWKYSGRSATSRRTITATVAPSGYKKMSENWIYREGAS